jgi:hypothetical protein
MVPIYLSVLSSWRDASSSTWTSYDIIMGTEGTELVIAVLQNSFPSNNLKPHRGQYDAVPTEKFK